MTYHKRQPGLPNRPMVPGRVTCDHTLRYERRDDPDAPLGWDMVSIKCPAEVTRWYHTTATALRDLARARGWQRRKSGDWVDLCPQHRIAYRNPTPYGRRR